MADERFDPLDEPIEAGESIDERAQKLLDESDGNEDPDFED
jgi:hypothetical protein